MSRVLSSLFTSYKKILAQHPLKVQSLQTALLMSSGDVIAQNLFAESDTKYDFYRSLRFALIGGIIGPSIHIWYGILDRFIGRSPSLKARKSNFRLKKPLLKVAVDQGMFAPLFLAIFISTNSFLEGKRIEEIKLKLKEDYSDILMANYKVWPAVQVVNFSLIPLQYRVLFLQTIALAWNTYLAWKLNLVKPEIKKTSLIRIDR